MLDAIRPWSAVSLRSSAVLATEPALGVEDLALDPATFVAHEEGDEGGDVVRCPPPTTREARRYRGVGGAGGVAGVDGTWVDAVGDDPVVSERVGDRWGHEVERPLRHRVGELPRHAAEVRAARDPNHPPAGAAGVMALREPLGEE